MPEFKTVTIASGAAESEAFEFVDRVFLKVYMPAAWTAASLAFKAAAEKAGPYNPLKDENGALLELTVAADEVIAVPAVWLVGCQWLKLWSETSGADTNQGGDRAISLVRV